MGLPSNTYDVFLSYNSRDHQAVERVGCWLKDTGLTCFMDRWYLVPGRPWQSALLEALKQSGACVVFLGPGGMGGWQQRELDLALDRQVSCGMLVVPVLLPGADPALSFLSLNTWVDLRARLDDERPLKLLAGAVRGQAPAELGLDGHRVAATVCPFRGLLPYREEDAPFFFGRESDTNRLVEAVARHPFVAVLGASGSGKSSVARAGLVPRLRADRATVWEVAAMVPTARPLNSLVNALSSLLWPDLDDEVDRREKSNEKASSLEKGSLSLHDLVEIALEKQPGTQRLLLLVDQWEELYTLCRDDRAIRLFTDQLLEASQSCPLTVIFTCRADFYGHVLGYRPLVERIVKGAQVLLGPMDERELKQVIEAPASKMGLEFEPGLPARILGDVGLGPGRLPLLSFLLEQLWKQRRGSVLTNEAFDAMGGVEGAIATVAEGVFDRLPAEDQARLSRLFIQLVSVGEEAEDTRRRAAMTTLGDEARPLVAELARARLLVTDSDQGAETVEVAHEALIRHWKRSQEWVNNARGFLTWRKRLEPFVKEWQARKRDRAALIRGSLLVEAQDWLEERRQDLDVPEREFIEASLRQQERDRNTRRWIEKGVALLSVVAFVAASVAWYQRGLAVESEKLAKTNEGIAKANELLAKSNESRAKASELRATTSETLAKTNEIKALRNFSASLAAQSAAVRVGFPLRSVLLASEAVYVYKKKGLDPVVAAEQSLRDSLQNLGGVGLGEHDAAVGALAMSPDGRWLVTGGDGIARLWDLKADRPETTARALEGHDGGISEVAISPNARWLVTGSNDKTVLLWNLKAERPETTALTLKGHDGVVKALAMSPDGRWLATGGNDRTVLLWNLDADHPETTALALKGHDGGVNTLALSPDGRWLAAGGTDGITRLWNLNAKRPETTALTLKKHNSSIAALGMSPDSRWLVTGNWDTRGATAYLWDLKAERPETTARELKGHQGGVEDVAMSPDGRWLVTGNRDEGSTARLWDLKAERPETTARVLTGHKFGRKALVISPNGRWLATGSSGDGIVRLWDLEADQPETTALTLNGDVGGVNAVAMSPDSRWLVTGNRDNGTVLLWDLTLARPDTTGFPLNGHDGGIRTLAISPDGRWLATGSNDKTARLWDLKAVLPETTDVFSRVQAGTVNRVQAGAVEVVVISPDGRWLATGGDVGPPRLWDLKADRPETTALALGNYGDGVNALAISPDGRSLVTGGGWTARLWDLKANRPETTARFLEGHTGGIRALAISPDGRWLATGSNDKTARLWDLKAVRPETTALTLEGHAGSIRALAISPDSRWLATGGDDGTPRLWDLKADRPETTALILKGHDHVIDALAISPDGRWLVTRGEGSIARLWDLKADQPETTARALGGHRYHVKALAISPNGRWLVTGSSGDGIVRLWDLKADQPEATARTLIGDAGRVYTMVISPDDRWLVTGGDGVVTLWDLKADRPEATARTLKGHKGPIWAVAISPDGRWLFAGGRGMDSLLWPLSLDELLRQSERAVGRNFTRQEWKEIFPDEPYRETFKQPPAPADVPTPP